MAGEYIEFNNSTQPAINDTNLNLLQQLIKQDMHSAVSGDTLPIGAIMPFGSNTIPENWLLCDGSAVSRTTYQYLFNTIGTTYGTGDGFTTFNLPDLRGKVVVGLDSNDTSFDVLGETGGEKEHTLTINEMPSHTHTGVPKYYRATNVEQATESNSQTGSQGVTSSTGGNQPHNILQPYIVQNYIIKADQSSGVLATVVDNLTSTSSIDALSANQGKVLKELLEGTTLYNNSNGTTGNVTLSQDISNMKRIRISGFQPYGSPTVNFYFTQDFDVVINQRAGIISKSNDGGVNSYIATELITIGATTITRGTQYNHNLTTPSRGETSIYITKVVGFNY